MKQQRLWSSDVTRPWGAAPLPVVASLLLALVLLLTAGQPAVAEVLRPVSHAAQSVRQAVGTQAAPEVGGTALVPLAVPGVVAFADPDVDAETLTLVRDAIALSLTEVPALTGLPPFRTPIVAYVLADDERFRLALAELGQVRVELVAEDIGGYTIERDGTMLVFFAAPNLTGPASALVGFAHEFAHLAVREATQRRAVPQWFNEGYASWIAWRALGRHFPADAALQQQLDRASVASALHTRGVIPWSDLVTRVRFSRAGVDGLVNLAYGQSTLFIDFLAERHGTPSLARFLTALGDGTGATQAFAAAFAPFGAESTAFEQTFTSLRAELQPGLHVIQQVSADRAAVLAVVGGAALETAALDLYADGVVIRRREFELDGAGLMVASLAPFLLDGDEDIRVRISVPQLGVLELDPRTDLAASPNVPRRPATGPTRQRPAPVQVPAGGRPASLAPPADRSTVQVPAD